MENPFRWEVQDRYGNRIYLTQERWEHIIDPINHPEFIDWEDALKDTILKGQRIQDSINPQKYRYIQSFENLPTENTHIVVIVLYRFKEVSNEVLPNNYIVTAYQKQMS